MIGLKRSALIAFLLNPLFSVPAAQEPTIRDEDIHPLSFVEMTYPIGARLRHIQGVVVIKLALRDDGTVSSGWVVAGAQGLAEESLANAKKWKFRANSLLAAVIVYNFKIEGLCNSPCPSQFRFSPPNIATITIAESVVDHSAQ